MCRVTKQLSNGWTYSIKGLRSAVTHQFAMQIELFLSVIIIPLAFFLGPTPVARAVMIGSWLLVLIVELINSAIETTVDRVGTEFHELSGRAKDHASAAVLIAIINAIVIWGIIIIGMVKF